MKNDSSTRFAFYQPDVVLFRHWVDRELAKFFRTTKTFDLSEKRILDVGCGWGGRLLSFMNNGARPENLCGIDLTPERVEAARHRLPKSEIVLGQAEKLPWANDRFDLVFQFTLFSSILSPQARKEAAEEIWRVLKPGGHFLSFDFFISNPNSPHTVAIGKRELRRMFPGASFRWRRVGVFPPLGRRLAPVSMTLTYLLERMRILSGHYIAWSTKK